jgi:hypothetical protein
VGHRLRSKPRQDHDGFAIDVVACDTHGEIVANLRDLNDSGRRLRGAGFAA